MHRGPDTKQHSNQTCSDDIERAASIGTGVPVHFVGAVSE